MTFELKKNIKNFSRNVTKSNLAMKLVSNCIYWYVRLIGKTTRWKCFGIENFYKVWEDNQGVILLAWHGRALMLPHFWNHEKEINALVSLHRDGRMIAGLLERFGLGTIGGSSNENACGAALELMRSLKHDTSICIIPDGPRGPRMHMGRSPIYFAQKTGKPIVALTYSVKWAKFIDRAWDKMMIPLPFSKGICVVSEPLFIPADATEEQLETYRIQMENMLNQINYECDTRLGHTPILPDDSGSCKIKRDHSWKGDL